MTSGLCSEARTRSTLSPAFQLGNGLRRRIVCVFFSAGVGDLGGGAQGGLGSFFENNGHGSWLFIQVLILRFVFKLCQSDATP